MLEQILKEAARRLRELATQAPEIASRLRAIAAELERVADGDHSSSCDGPDVFSKK